jgi:hypothetical protein
VTGEPAAAAGGRRVTLRRTGGLFAGNVLQTTVAEEELSAPHAAELAALLAPVDVASLAARSPIAGTGADRYQYDLAVEQGGETRRIIAPDGAVPEQLAPLVDWLERRATAEREAARG